MGLSTNLTSFEVINELIGTADTNSVYDFDLVKENSRNLNSKLYQMK